MPTIDTSVAATETAATALETTLPDFITTPPRKPRVFRGVGPTIDPVPSYGVKDGKPVASVPLSGSHGVGKSYTVDADEIPMIEERWGLHFTVSDCGHVTSCRRAATVDATHGNGEEPRAILARLLTDAHRGQIVWAINRDKLDLRRANLELISRAEFLARLRALRFTK